MSACAFHKIRVVSLLMSFTILVLGVCLCFIQNKRCQSASLKALSVIYLLPVMIH